MSAAKRIPDLNPIAGASTANNDNLVIFDTDADETKRILRSQLAAGMVGDLPYTPSGGISATTIPTAIAELDSEAAKSAALAASGGSSLVGFLQAGSGAVVRTAQSKMRDTVSVKDFGAVGDGVADDTAAFVAALASSDYVFVPPGIYKVGAQIDITGNKTIEGSGGGNHEALPSRINFTAPSGNCFSATSAEFGGITIRNLSITGGNGSYAIRSSRPQSVFENLKMEPFTGGGIELFEAGTGSQASWGTVIRNVKWVGPASQTAYRGFQVAQNGGHLTLERCVAVYGSIGLNIDQGEAINVIACSFNQQQAAYSSELATAGQCGIRLSGSGYKRGISIRNCYIEAYTTGIWVEKCESLTIADNYIADVGLSSNYASVYTAGADAKNVSIINNHFNDNGNNASCIRLNSSTDNSVILNNYISTTGNGSACITVGSGMSVLEGGNKLIYDITGNGFVDASGVIRHLDTSIYGQIKFPATQIPSSNANTLDDYQEGTWTPVVGGLTNASGVNVTKATYTKIGRQVSIQVAGTIAVTAGATLTTFSLTIPENQGDLDDPASGVAVFDFTGVGACVDNTGGDANTIYVYFPANQVSGSGTRAFLVSMTYNAT